MKLAPVVVALILCAVLTWQWIGWPPAPPASEAASPTIDPVPTVPSSQPQLLARLEAPDARDNYVAIIEHPLFRPDRKPEPPADEALNTPASEESAELNAFDLNAVLITPDVVSAWVQDPAQPKLRRLRIGDDLQGWSVTDIQEDRVLLERQGQQDALILRDYSKVSPASAPPSTPSPTSRRSKADETPLPTGEREGSARHSRVGG